MDHILSIQLFLPFLLKYHTLFKVSTRIIKRPGIRSRALFYLSGSSTSKSIKLSSDGVS